MVRISKKPLWFLGVIIVWGCQAAPGLSAGYPMPPQRLAPRVEPHSPEQQREAAESVTHAPTHVIPAPELSKIPPKPTLRMQLGRSELEVFEHELVGEVILDGKVILRRDNSEDPAPWLDLVRYFGAIPPFENVLLFSWRGPGNLCFGSYGLTFLGIREDGTWEQADVPYCAGPSPAISSSPVDVTIHIPPHPPNRGTGTIPGETWIYKDGRVRKVGASNRKPSK